MNKLLLSLILAVYSTVNVCMEPNSSIQNFLLAQQIEQHNINQVDVKYNNIPLAVVALDLNQGHNLEEAERTEQVFSKNRLKDYAKIYKCDHKNCNFCTIYKKNLKVHTRIHTGEKPYICDYPSCNKPFRDSSSLQTHKRTHTGEKPYSCDYPGCYKAFSQSCNLTTHKRVHTDQRPYACNYLDCSKAFKRLEHLTRHTRIHKGERPYKCPQCDYSTGDTSNLNYHLRKTHQ